MSAVAVASIAFGAILLSIAVGLLLRDKLPEAHLSGDSKDVIRLATALIGTMSAVVLALLFASTRGSFETTMSEVSQLTAHVIELDNVLKEYGPEGEPLRVTLRRDADSMVGSIWRDDPSVPPGPEPATAMAQEVLVLGQARLLVPGNPQQVILLSRAISVGTEIEKLRLTLLADPPDAIAKPFVIVLVLWLCFIFASFSMSAKANPTLVTMLFICAFSASSAIYLILELGQPFDGLMQIPNGPLRHALAPLPGT